MTLWKVEKCFTKEDEIKYSVHPYDLKGYLKACIEWHGIKGLKWCYLFEKQAERKARKLNEVKNND